MWQPRDKRSVLVVKLCIWSGLLTWMVLSIAYAVTAANRLGLAGPELFGLDTRGQVLTWMVPVWVIFTVLMLVWAVARFASRRLNKREGGTKDEHRTE